MVMTTELVLMILTMVLEHTHVCKKDFYGGKHHLEVDKVHFYSVLMTSPPDPLSAIKQSNSWKPYAEMGKEIEKGGSLGESPFSKRNPGLTPMACKRQWGRGKRGGGKRFESIGNRKIIPRKSVTYV
jgi:hypothetical protein